DSYKGSSVRTIATTVQLDPADATTLVIAPTGEAIAAGAFYRLTENGARDLQATAAVQTVAKVVDLFAFATVKPVVTIAPPATTQLVSGLAYTFTATMTDEETDPPAVSQD